MDSFASEERIVALNKAIKKIRRIKKSSVGYCYGVSDCWTLFCEYDNLLRNNDQKLKNMFLGYTSQEEWFATLETLGFSSPEAMLKSQGWVEVPFEDSEIGDMAAFSYKHDGSMWSTGLKISNNDWHSSSNLPELDVLKSRFVSKQLRFSLRAIK